MLTRGQGYRLSHPCLRAACLMDRALLVSSAAETRVSKGLKVNAA